MKRRSIATPCCPTAALSSKDVFRQELRLHLRVRERGPPGASPAPLPPRAPSRRSFGVTQHDRWSTFFLPNPRAAPSPTRLSDRRTRSATRSPMPSSMPASRRTRTGEPRRIARAGGSADRVVPSPPSTPPPRYARYSRAGASVRATHRCCAGVHGPNCRRKQRGARRLRECAGAHSFVHKCRE